MPKENQILTLTSHVYGPYYDYIIFKDSFPENLKTTLEIKDLQMFTNDGEVGFDQTEFIGQPPEGSLGAKNETVVFFGVLTIASLDWLSERGLEWLQRDLRNYDELKHLEHDQSGLTLTALYGDRTWKGSRLKVKIAADKNFPAHFLTSRVDKGKLFMYSFHEGKRRRYSVESLHVTAFNRSRNYFDRYRLRALIDELIATDPHTPVENRNIDWIILRYLNHIHPKDAQGRIFIDPDLDPEIYTEPRHLNHLPRARIRHFFAAQSEWILAHMLASSSKQVKLLNIKEWIRFCREARLDSIEAKKHGVRWGMPHGEKVVKGTYDLSRNLAKFGHSPSFWKRRLEIVNEKPEPSKVPSKTLSPKPQRDQPQGDQPQGDQPQGDQPSPQTAKFQYDSDFSEPSTPGEPESDAEETTNAAPEYCMKAPRIPCGSTTWSCPAPGCDHKLDLVDVSLMVRNLPQFRGDQIRLGDDWDFRTSLLMLISRHYESHLERAGVEIFPSSSTAWLVKPLQHPIAEKAAIKREDVDELQVRRSGRKAQPRRQFEL